MRVRVVVRVGVRVRVATSFRFLLFQVILHNNSTGEIQVLVLGLCCDCGCDSVVLSVV